MVMNHKCIVCCDKMDFWGHFAFLNSFMLQSRDPCQASINSQEFDNYDQQNVATNMFVGFNKCNFFNVFNFFLSHIQEFLLTHIYMVYLCAGFYPQSVLDAVPIHLVEKSYVWRNLGCKLQRLFFFGQIFVFRQIHIFAFCILYFFFLSLKML